MGIARAETSDKEVYLRDFVREISLAGKAGYTWCNEQIDSGGKGRQSLVRH